jgi:hypothetical protein
VRRTITGERPPAHTFGHIVEGVAMHGHGQRTTKTAWLRVGIAVLAVAAVVPVAHGARSPARAATAVPRVAHIVIQPQRLATGALAGVAAVSAKDAWAVGTTSIDFDTSHGHALIEHWNGSAWTVLPSPVGPGSHLDAVAARSANDAWAVGSVSTGTSNPRQLILRWDGHTWKRIASPTPGHGSTLNGVTELSRHDAWAVGSMEVSLGRRLLIEHWNGHVWKRVVKTPRLPKGFIDAALNSVSGTSAHNVWAVGSMTNCGCGPGLPVALHWNGRVWTRHGISGLRSPYNLNGVDVVSARRAFVAGETGEGDSPTHAQIARFTGRRWGLQHTPSPHHTGRPSDFLSGVSAVTRNDAWAVGQTASNVLLERFNGRAWRQVDDRIVLPQIAPGVSPGAHDDTLAAVASTSRTNAWAVGAVHRRLANDSLALILHWNGSAWSCCDPLAP